MDQMFVFVLLVSGVCVCMLRLAVQAKCCILRASQLYGCIKWYQEQCVDTMVCVLRLAVQAKCCILRASQLYGCFKWYHEQCVDAVVCVLRLAVQAK
jgi:hypothetical protein